MYRHGGWVESVPPPPVPEGWVESIPPYPAIMYPPLAV